jgi:alpha-L-fucosidase
MPLLVKNARARQPGLIVVDRAVPGVYQNYLTPEQHIPEEGLPYPWETCMTMGQSWSYVPNDVYKPVDELLRKLVDIISKGGNLLLNIGPGPDGEWSDTAYQRLEAIGKWMKINGGAIYHTRMYKHFSQGDSIRFSQSDDGKTKFIYLFAYPEKELSINQMVFPGNADVQLLGSDHKINWRRTNDGAVIQLPQALKTASRYIWVLKVSEKPGTVH